MTTTTYTIRGQNIDGPAFLSGLSGSGGSWTNTIGFALTTEDLDFAAALVVYLQKMQKRYALDDKTGHIVIHTTTKEHVAAKMAEAHREIERAEADFYAHNGQELV